MDIKSINVTKASNATDEVIEAWKKAYPTGIAEISVPFGEADKDGSFAIVYRCWVRKPTRNEMRELSAKEVDRITYGECILEMLWLGGDTEIKTVDEVFYSAIDEVQKVMTIQKGVLKKL